MVFAIGPEAQDLQVRIEIICATAQAAADVANRLTAATDLLKKMLERDHITPNSRDLTSVLTAGKFQQNDKRVTGTWPVDRSFLEALAAGQVE